jgi:hypothetical protein
LKSKFSLLQLFLKDLSDEARLLACRATGRTTQSVPRSTLDCANGALKRAGDADASGQSAVFMAMADPPGVIAAAQAR